MRLTTDSKPIIGCIALWLCLISTASFAAPVGATASTAPTAPPSVSSSNSNSGNSKTVATAVDGNKKPSPPNLYAVIKKLETQLAQQATRLASVEQANNDALARNQILQLDNDNLMVQVKVLQGDRSAQMFLYGAFTVIFGALVGFLFANHLHRRTRRW